MNTQRLTACCLAVLAAALGCATPPPPKPAQHRFYKHPDVRACLDLEQQRKPSEAQSCWAGLVRRLDGEPGFRTSAELTEADVERIQRKAGLAGESVRALRRELDACLDLPAGDRSARRACYEAYLAKHTQELTRTERYEIEQAIAGLAQNAALARGEVEATLEHAGRLLGGRLGPEDEGVRLESLDPGGVLTGAGLPAQGLIVELDGMLATELDAAERIARLEACEERPVQVLVRHGDLQQVAFLRAELRCGPQGAGRRLAEAHVPVRTCTQASSPELRLGVNWCFNGRDGLLEVADVCAGSPADLAELHPGQQLARVNGLRLLGQGPDKLLELLATFPAYSLAFEDRAGTLQSPRPVAGPEFPEDKRQRCWQAIQKRLQEPESEDTSTESGP
ncbi:MAG TPA: hypothetical protein PK668_24620 [Myxococcota bacterium]|nr:hypothetical protein [Myxococcota bacterium]HRY96876.1 hypothetical protein [Myxococcota bacterium]HSA24711.1 hypothetical protein [Myxococcota bacterium]